MQLMELMAFFSGYPLFYAVILFFFDNKTQQSIIKKNIVFLLPYSYALVGTLYIGLLLKNIYPDYSYENIQMSIYSPLLILWGILSLLFWIPYVAKKTAISLFHSFVFFFFILKDLLVQLLDSSVDKDIVRNDMNMYTASLFINLGSFLFVFVCSILIKQFKNAPKS